MTTYTKLDPQPAQREEAMLLRYSKAEALAGDLPWPCPWDQVSPGLYPDEIAYQLDTSENVAISVEKDWCSNITGFHAYARWIEADGSTKVVVAPDDQQRQIEVSWSFSLSTADVNTFGLTEIMKDCYRMLLGDAPTLTHDIKDENDVVIGQTPLIELDPQSNTNRSIRGAIELLSTFDQHVTVDL
jgi:hypothetical protein